MVTDNRHTFELDYLFGKARQGILSLLLLNQDKSFYLREIVRRTGLGLGPVQREVKNLVKAGIITKVNIGNQVHYQADEKCPIFGDLKSILTKTSGIADLIKISLSPLADKIRLAFIYGSFAKGTSRSESDVDLMVVGDVMLLDVVSALVECGKVLNREINASVYEYEEFVRKRKAGHNFIKRVCSGPVIRLIGSDYDFESLGR
jgi:predicted nucleotidyltransferase